MRVGREHIAGVVAGEPERTAKTMNCTLSLCEIVGYNRRDIMRIVLHLNPGDDPIAFDAMHLACAKWAGVGTNWCSENGLNAVRLSASECEV